MKLAQKLGLTWMALLVPYMLAALYVGFHTQNDRVPMKYVYGMLAYMVCAIALFIYLRKKMIAKDAALTAPTPTEKSASLLKSAKALRRLGYILLVVNAYNALKWDYAHEPIWETGLGLTVAAAWVVGCFYYANKLNRRAEEIPLRTQTVGLAATRDSERT